MNKPMVLGLLGFALLATPIFAHPNSKSTRSAIARSYSAMDQGIEHRNVSPMQKWLDSGFTVTRMGQITSNKKETIDDMKQMASHAQNIKFHRKITRFWFVKNNAISLVSAYFSAQFKGPNGTKMSNKLLAKSKDTWIEKHGQWFLKRSVIYQSQPFFNGKPMTMGHAKPGASQPSKAR